ncbi:hypothetical protein [Paraburkholderia phenazinium]|uniref:hypothetical protein n=1 Tax=Paraburkholderia phenazinium TaxID=60549 RepID=UPI00158AE429|nr:hypothetical protein [Paraburkholderia phenazinium]
MLKKTVVIASCGAPAALHKVANVTLNYDSNSTIVSIASYYDAAALGKKLNPISMSSITISGLPAKGQDSHAFVEAALVEPAQEGQGTTDQLQAYTANRYVFAGAEIVADA